MVLKTIKRPPVCSLPVYIKYEMSTAAELIYLFKMSKDAASFPHTQENTHFPHE